MKISIKKGLGFGLTSGVITTLGLLVGLNSSTGSAKIVIGGILVIAIADSFADALGVHISEESENKAAVKDTWIAAITAFITKLLLSLSFLTPVLLLDLDIAIIVSIIWGAILLTLFSLYIARQNDSNPAIVVIEHLGIATLVVIATFYIGKFVSIYFN